jgi:uncharacterized protein YbjQ (UPF0145 family)
MGKSRWYSGGGCKVTAVGDSDVSPKGGIMPPGLQHTLTTTAFTLDGFRIAKNLGVVRGITVRSRSLFGTIGGSLQTLVGGNISLFTELCEKTRAESFDMMIEHAREQGANAVIGIRYDATELMQGVSEVLCYGTAVVVEAVGQE